MNKNSKKTDKNTETKNTKYSVNSLLVNEEVLNNPINLVHVNVKDKNEGYQTTQLSWRGKTIECPEGTAT